MSAHVAQQSRYSLILSDAERDGLLALLRQAFGEARVEAHRTHTPDFRDLVIGQQAVIRALVEKLERLVPESMRAPAPAFGIEAEGPLVEELAIDGVGRFQMAAADLEDFLPFLRDHEVRVEVENSEAFRSGGEAYGYGRLVHPYDADSVRALFRTWKLAQGTPTACVSA